MKDFYTLADLREGKAIDPSIRLGVFGDPVAHSLSPRMQNAALEKCGIGARYAAFQIRPIELWEALSLLAGLGFVGINLTSPHKIAALGWVDEVQPWARAVGAINTIRFEGRHATGFNTDGPGFANAIREEFSEDLRNLRVLIFGAGGGAGRAIVHQCAQENCPRLVLVNRDVGKAKVLAKELGAEALEWSEPFTLPGKIDLIVNATPLGRQGTDAAIIGTAQLHSRLLVYDTIYAPRRTPWLEAAAEAGARTGNGLSMLLHQGALAFETWFNHEAPLDVMRAALSVRHG